VFFVVAVLRRELRGYCRDGCCFRGADEGDVGNLRRAVEAEGKADGAEALVHVKLHVAEVEEAFHVFSAHGREDERTDDGKPDLTAVGVAGEHHVDERESGVLHNRIDEVRLVAHEEDGRVGHGHGRDSEVQIAGGRSGIAGAGEPEVVVTAFDGDVAINQHRGAMGLEHVDDLLRADENVVVAKYGVALRSFKSGKNFGAYSGGFEGEGYIARTPATEVSGEENELWVEGVDTGDGLLEERGLGVLLEVDVRELSHAEALEGIGEFINGEGARKDLYFVACVKAGVRGHSEAGSGPADHESTAGYGVSILTLNAPGATRHSP